MESRLETRQMTLTSCKNRTFLFSSYRNSKIQTDYALRDETDWSTPLRSLHKGHNMLGSIRTSGQHIAIRRKIIFFRHVS